MYVKTLKYTEIADDYDLHLEDKKDQDTPTFNVIYKVTQRKVIFLCFLERYVW